VADFETKLRQLSERGNPVGVEDMIERIEAELAGDPLIVVTRRRKGSTMTKTDEPVKRGVPGPGRGLGWAVAAFVVVIAVGGLYFILANDEPEVADTMPPPSPTTTVISEPEAMTDLEVIEAGVAAFYSGDAERAAELFELPDRTDDQIREEAAYQAAIGGRLTLSCSESSPGRFTCLTPYENAMTDAIGEGGGQDTWPVVVEDGVITQFGFTEHSEMLLEMGTFLASEFRFDGYESCGFGPFPESCATIQLENLDAWAEWRQDYEPADVVQAALSNWHRGYCEAALFLAGEKPAECSATSSATETMAYESTLSAQAAAENCESVGAETLSCEVHYTNTMNRAVGGKPPSVTVVEFLVGNGLLVLEPADGQPWYEGVYPEDTELRESFRLFAEGGNLRGAYTDAGCAIARTPECANLIMDNRDEWANWHQANQ
jgi:hypothetical protein